MNRVHCFVYPDSDFLFPLVSILPLTCGTQTFTFENTCYTIDLLHIPDLILKLCFYTIFIRVISLTTGKIISGLVREMEMTTNLIIIFS
jgi:hypothetical protein